MKVETLKLEFTVYDQSIWSNLIRTWQENRKSTVFLFFLKKFDHFFNKDCTEVKFRTPEIFNHFPALISGRITALCAAALLLIQAAGRVMLHKRSTRLRAAVSYHYKTITHCRRRCENPLQITTLVCWKIPTYWLKAGEQRENATWQLSQRPHMTAVTLAAVCSKKTHNQWTCKHHAHVARESKNSHAVYMLWSKYCCRDARAGNQRRRTNSSCNPAKAKQPCS